MQTEVTTTTKKKGGWPKGKPRGKKKRVGRPKGSKNAVRMGRKPRQVKEVQLEPISHRDADTVEVILKLSQGLTLDLRVWLITVLTESLIEHKN